MMDASRWAKDGKPATGETRLVMPESCLGRLVMHATAVMKRDGLQPTCDGLQPDGGKNISAWETPIL